MLKSYQFRAKEEYLNGDSVRSAITNWRDFAEAIRESKELAGVVREQKEDFEVSAKMTLPPEKQ